MQTRKDLINRDQIRREWLKHQQAGGTTSWTEWEVKHIKFADAEAQLKTVNDRLDRMRNNPDADPIAIAQWEKVQSELQAHINETK